MKTYSIYYNIALNYLRMRNVSHKVADKIKKHILCSITFSKIVPLWDNVEKYGKVRQATDGNII
jgi:hypothetical protein